MPTGKNQNHAKWNANRSKKLRSINMSDEESEKLSKLAALRQTSRSETVNQLVDEETRRMGRVHRDKV